MTTSMVKYATGYNQVIVKELREYDGVHCMSSLIKVEINIGKKTKLFFKN